jgi:sulfur relay protein TusB/DsrH
LLVILSKPFSANNDTSILDIILKAAKEGEKVGILHIHDSCIMLTSDQYYKKLVNAGLNVYALKADCEARGLLKKTKGVKLVTYREWVQLVMNEYKKIVSWN